MFTRLREGMAIGAKVTLRGQRMYEFLDKLVSVSLPRVRDFHGVSKRAFDGRKFLALLTASPTPMLITILSTLGACMIDE